MSEAFSYRDYVNDERFLEEYNSYQSRYATTIRESDKIIVQVVRELIDSASGHTLDIVDVGCSTGNLLLHLKRLAPGASYGGGDLARSSIDKCRANAELDGVTFQTLDVLDLPQELADVIIVNAVVYMFDDAQFARALGSIGRALRPGGTAILFDFAHPFVHQKLTIYETSVMHPDGIRLSFRPIPYFREVAVGAGFSQIDFYPFEIPIDLPMPAYDEEVVTYTVPKEDGDRLMFRGALAQPWCHIIARK